MKNLKSRIEKHLTTKSGSIAAKYSDAIYLIQHPEKVLRPCSWSRSKGHMNLRDSSFNTIQGLKAIQIDYVSGNDALRGGREGDFICLSAKGKRQVAYYNREVKAIAEKAKIEAKKAAELRKAEITAMIAAMPENSQFEAKWNSAELKNESGLSWSSYRESLKMKYPSEWNLLKAKYRTQQVA